MTQIRLIIDRQEDAYTANCHTREGCSVEKTRLLGNCHPREGGDPRPKEDRFPPARE